MEDALRINICVYVQLPKSAVNVALPAFAVALCGADLKQSPTRRAHSSKPAALCCSRRMGQTDERTDGRTPYRY